MQVEIFQLVVRCTVFQVFGVLYIKTKQDKTRQGTIELGEGGDEVGDEVTRASLGCARASYTSQRFIVIFHLSQS